MSLIVKELIPGILCQYTCTQVYFILRDRHHFILARYKSSWSEHSGRTALANDVEEPVEFHGQFYTALVPDSIAECALIGCGNIR